MNQSIIPLVIIRWLWLVGCIELFIICTYQYGFNKRTEQEEQTSSRSIIFKNTRAKSGISSCDKRAGPCDQK